MFIRVVPRVLGGHKLESSAVFNLSSSHRYQAGKCTSSSFLFDSVARLGFSEINMTSFRSSADNVSRAHNKQIHGKSYRGSESFVVYLAVWWRRGHVRFVITR